MVVRMIKWRPWPPAGAGRKVEARLVVRRVVGVAVKEEEEGKMAAEVRWKGGRVGLGALRRGAKRNWTRGEVVGDGGVVVWDEEFRSVCSLTAYKESGFHPWAICFTVFSGLKQASKNKVSVIGTAALNLAEFASSAAKEEIEIDVPLRLLGATTGSHPTLHLSLSLLELRTYQESPEIIQRCIMPVTSSPPHGDAMPSGKDDASSIRAGLRKVKILSEFVSSRKARKAGRDDDGSEGKCSARSEDGEYAYPFDTDSLDADDDKDFEDDNGSSLRKSFSYGSLASANHVGDSLYFDVRINGEHEDWVYYSHRRPDVGSSHVEETTLSIPDHSLLQSSKRIILPWNKRKLHFRSAKAKGEPLLKKGYEEEGGDDIDFDRRQLSSSDESLSTKGQKVDDDGSAHSSSISDFGDDNFVIGSWEPKEVVSRDGQLKLSAQVFFASIDQRSERAAGESACTALVAVIANWFQSNKDMMPIRSQFDSLIRDGSLEWRNLCENQMYRERFPDKHFDLETVLMAKICPLSANPGKSFIGFFQPEGTDNNSGFDFLHGAMSFDSIWDEISHAATGCPADRSPLLYIVSWNDHFFVLMVERDAYYIIDTLGERLYEGCNQAYILKFDESTSIRKIQTGKQPFSSEAATEGKEQDQDDKSKEGSTSADRRHGNEVYEEIVCRGKESCKEYIKSFLAAIPIRELQADIKKGLMALTPLHHRLQIEFHYMEASEEIVAAATPAPESAIVFSCPPEPAAAAAAAFSLTAMKLEVEVV